MIMPKESRDLRKRMKRFAWFLIPLLIIDSFICFLFYKYTKMHPALCGFIIICISTILYLLFSFICAKIDKKNKEKLERNKNKDPFTKG